MILPRFKLVRSRSVPTQYFRLKSIMELIPEKVPQTQNPGPRPGVLVTPRKAVSEKLEVVIDAQAQHVGFVAVGHAGDRISAVAQVHVEVFRLRRPVRRDADLHAQTADPADMGLVLVEAVELAFDLTTVSYTHLRAHE